MNKDKATIIEIHPECKYILRFNKSMSQQEVDFVVRQIDEWLCTKNSPVCVMDNSVEIVRLDMEQINAT